MRVIVYYRPFVYLPSHTHVRLLVVVPELLEPQVRVAAV